VKLNTTLKPDTATGDKLAESDITDKRGYAAHWHFSSRKVDDLLARGLPHLRVGSRRVRILVSEADAWMRQQFAVQRRGEPTPTVKEGGAQ
jgi:hypothetical protein